MRGAMARVLTVNDSSGSPPVRRAIQGLNLDPEPAAADFEFGVERASYGVETTRDSGSSTNGKNRNDQGPCLYFGPQGQRCGRPALSNGFCARHLPVRLNQSAQLGQSARPRLTLPISGRKPRIAAIVFAALALIESFWPTISELFRALIRLIHAH
jgi:hypothetical protein